MQFSAFTDQTNLFTCVGLQPSMLIQKLAGKFVTPLLSMLPGSLGHYLMPLVKAALLHKYMHIDGFLRHLKISVLNFGSMWKSFTKLIKDWCDVDVRALLTLSPEALIKPYMGMQVPWLHQILVPLFDLMCCPTGFWSRQEAQQDDKSVRHQRHSRL